MEVVPRLLPTSPHLCARHGWEWNETLSYVLTFILHHINVRLSSYINDMIINWDSIVIWNDISITKQVYLDIRMTHWQNMRYDPTVGCIVMNIYSYEYKTEYEKESNFIRRNNLVVYAYFTTVYRMTYGCIWKKTSFPWPGEMAGTGRGKRLT